MNSPTPITRITFSWRAKLSLLILSVVFALFLGEILLRVYSAVTSHNLSQAAARARKPNGSFFTLGDIVEISPNPRLIYDLAPNRNGYFGAAPYHSNSHGMRGPETTLAKPDHVFRIATLGDSSMFGWCVGEDQPYVRVLEQALNAADDPMRYEVLNFAVPGYNTALEAEMFASKAAKFNPDLVILQFDINDLTLPTFVVDETRWWSPTHCFIWDFARGALHSQSVREKILGIQGTGLKEGSLHRSRTESGKVTEFLEYQASLTPSKFRYMVGWDGVLSAINHLWAVTSVPVLHLSMPYPANVALANLGRKDDHDRFAEHVLEASKRQPRLHYLDISQAGMDFAKLEKADLYKDFVIKYPDDTHPSVERHILIARETYLYLVRNEMLPRGSNHYLYSDEIAERMWEQADTAWKQRRPK